jgi:hypothetical protein
VRGRKEHAELNPELPREAVAAGLPENGRAPQSARDLTELEAAGYVNERCRPFNANRPRSIRGRFPPPWYLEEMPSGYRVTDARGRRSPTSMALTVVHGPLCLVRSRWPKRALLPVPSLNCQSLTEP